MEFLNDTSFQMQIEEIVQTEKIDYMDAVIKFCDTNDLEYSDLKKLISSNLKDKLRLCAEENGLMRKTPKLEFE